ncbi:MAG: glycosyltransferase [Rhodobacteraceae bacterium]|nr:glycosyltransferase [Paracoccaceae bacterium]
MSLSMSEKSLTFAKDGVAAFDTSANMLNLGKWRRHCGLNDLKLQLEGAGEFYIEVFQVLQNSSRKRLYTEVARLSLGTSLVLDLSQNITDEWQGCVVFFLRALGRAKLTAATWVTEDAPRQLPSLALSITTFKREAAVQTSVERFKHFMTKTHLAPYLHLIVVDNGQSANIATSEHVTAIENANLGGSGGFSRGLLEAESRGASHCLFMDDDASINMGAIERTWNFLAYAENTKTAVAGGITMANQPWALWESGATFDRVCRPLWGGTDLRSTEQALAMEHGSTGAKPHNFYGGWWYFAFPIKQITYHPFPFFVRGDDVSFSLANDFEIVTLPGVVCFQDADFSDKESLQTLYLDLRSHLVNHLALPQMDIGRWGVVGIAARFFARSMMQCHYDSLAALNLAVSDVLRGPAFFAANCDMAERRARLGKMRQTEAWRPLEGAPPASRRRFDPRGSRFWLLVMKYSLNGMFLPLFGLWGNQVTLKSGQRGQLHEIWGASQVTYVNADGSQMFIVRHSKARALREGLKMIANMTRLALQFSDIRALWRKGYADLTTQGFWTKTLGLETPQAAAPERTAP